MGDFDLALHTCTRRYDSLAASYRQQDSPPVFTGEREPPSSPPLKRRTFRSAGLLLGTPGSTLPPSYRPVRRSHPWARPTSASRGFVMVSSIAGRRVAVHCPLPVKAQHCSWIGLRGAGCPGHDGSVGGVLTVECAHAWPICGGAPGKPSARGPNGRSDVPGIRHAARDRCRRLSPARE